MALGLLLRLVAINQPLIDAHSIRQCYTAVGTRSMLREPGMPLTSRVNWRGDRDVRIGLEIPVYNYLTIGVNKVIQNLDASGKLVSIALWLLSFFVLQEIWKRCLSEAEAFWANGLFVLSPVSIFFSQSFMPEMLVQLLGFTLIWRLLCYVDSRKRGDFFLFATV